MPQCVGSKEYRRCDVIAFADLLTIYCLMTRLTFVCVVIAFAAVVSPLLACGSDNDEPSDLKVQLRSATGFNCFQVGEVIPLELVFSSAAPGKYLEPCLFLDRSCFGYPVCRFANHGKLSITPEEGWVDFDRPCFRMSGPTFLVEDHDLTAQPKIFPYELTKRFRFDTPGKYTVRLTIDVGLDDASNPRRDLFKPIKQPAERHSVTLNRELVLEIVPAAPEWQKDVIARGVEAYSRPAPRSTKPPSPELVQYQQATRALCNLGTPEAAHVFVKLFLQGHGELETCMRRSANVETAIEDLERLLVDPDVPVNGYFFQFLITLLSTPSSKVDVLVVDQQIVDKERERLFAALPKKKDEARITSLMTVLQNPPRSEPLPGEVAYGLPFGPAVIDAVVANYDRLPTDSERWLLEEGWDFVRSPLLLPKVRKRAQDGFEPALLRWLELDPAAATAFIREEIVRPVPRFSSYYLRLPDASLPHQERQIAANFVALTNEYDLARAASLLYRYATRAVLPKVLPFIDSKRATWRCSVRLPVFAYLLKVSPKDAAPRLEQALHETNKGSCNTNTFFTDVGFLQPSSVLDGLALAETDAGTPFARDAADYLRKYGPSAIKPVIWEQIDRWHERIVASGAEKRMTDNVSRNDDRVQADVLRALVEIFIRAEAWVLSPDEVSRLAALLGNDKVSSMACMFHCGASLAIGSAPKEYAIYSHKNERWSQHTIPMDYLNPSERLWYSIDQYGCANMRALKQKLLQFPKGSTFSFAWDFSARDHEEIVEIRDFLVNNGYKVRIWQNWSFLRSNAPR